ncbi:hypothetical protein [Blastopirellula retiformator]|uniref:Legionella pneumophila major outer membrane protein n=1 Tax=Blastopirellula retiformator TaxID=2527970 RepID=A0A5C5V2V0_9BACT|nr:hypothetical protein [Blastopirellula retiformator]TWT32062.1 hypothetical protein Enr8_39880 [Blastopirellula retiformator]
MKMRHRLVAMAVVLMASSTSFAQSDDVFRSVYWEQEPRLLPVAFENSDGMASASDHYQTDQYQTACGPACGCCRSGWRVGVEATFLAPSGGNQAGWTFANATTPVTNSFATSDYGIGGLTPAPRIWASYVCDSGWGVQFRYWELNSSSNYNDPFFVVGDTFGYASGTNLEMYAFDLEAVKEFCVCDWNMVGTFGYRHAMRDTNETIGFNGIIARPGGLGGGNDIFAGTASGIANFEGDGLTFSLSGYRCSDCCWGLQWFWNARGSVLFGDTYVGALTHAQLISPSGNATQTNGGFAGSSDSIFVAEFQLGAQWSAPLKCIGGRFFVRGAFEYQNWGEMGGAAGATSTVGELNVGELTMNALAPSDSLDLVGFAFSTGIVW